MKRIEKSIKVGGKTLKLSTGDLANQADGSVLATYGETVVLATVVAQPLEKDLGYFPLTVEYQERLYAGGRIKGSRWVKREGRPSDDEILTARLIDRSIRPLFPEDYSKDVQLIITVLSVDLENPPDMVAGVAASAAIEISPIPWKGPVSVSRIGLREERYLLNPTESEIEGSDMDLIVSMTKDAVVMIEAGARQIPEEKVLGGIEFAKKEGQKIIELIKKLSEEVGNKKEKVVKNAFDKEIEKKVRKLALKSIKELIVKMASKDVSYQNYEEIKRAIVDNFENDEERTQAKKIFEKLFKGEVRKIILSGKRPDGRKADEIRKLTSQVSVLPRTHGSAIFQRGQTQALTIATLGAPSLEQFIESATGEETKRYIHHYSMPPYSVGETGRVGYPTRREIGHGALAERALLPAIPPEDDFPYTIRVVTEILSSNGSTSMAAACGSTLSLMDAGVPILAPIAGIAMGLVIESAKKFTILTDIVGLEDGNGDMDFKVAGSETGITALQLDVKTLNLTFPILEKALEQAKAARLEILSSMKKVIKTPRDSVSKHAPKIKIVKIDPDKIGELIGPGGKTIKRIIAETGAQIDVDDDGSVFVSGTTEEELGSALSQVEAITKVPVPGEIYDGEVKRVQPFGAFVEILPGKEGLVHVSDISEDFVRDTSEHVSVGDKVKVRVKGIDDLGRLNLSMVLDPGYDARKEDRKKEERGNRRRRFDKRRGRERHGGGPHFPTSRLVQDRKGSRDR